MRAMILDLDVKKLEHWFSDAHFNSHSQVWEFPDGEKLALKDAKDITEFLESKDAKGRYQIVRDDDGFLLFPMNGHGEALRYPEEPEKKNFNLRDSDINWKEWADIQPWTPETTATPWQPWTDSGTTNDEYDTQAWTIDNSLHVSFWRY